MKKQAIIFIIALMTAQVGLSQIRLGARVGGNYSKITNVHPNSISRIGGVQIGAFAFMSVSDQDILFFQPEINYSNQGEYDEQSDTDQKIFLNYINVPLNFKMYISSGKFSIFGEAGPYLGFLAHKNVDYYDGSLASGDKEKGIDGNSYNTFDFGGTLGVGFSINKRYEISLRYAQGFANQINNDQLSKNTHNSVINVGISYIFGISARDRYDFVY